MHDRQQDLTTDQFLEMAESFAREKTDGHFTLMRFTTGWKAMFETPDIVSGGFPGEGAEYDRISAIKTEKTVGDAILSAIYEYQHRPEVMAAE